MRVLIVDDDPIYRETSKMFLTMYGRSVSLAENGRMGLAIAAEADFDVMVCDLEMPDMNGLEVIAAIRAMPRHRNLPIIMVTSRDDAMAIDRAFELGASSFVVKPVNWTLVDHYLRFVLRSAKNEIAARQAHADAEALSRAKDNLLAVVRHEMKTPLNAIIGFTRLAAEAQASGDVTALKDQLEFVRQAGERLTASIGDMAAYSDLLSHQFRFSPESISASWVVGDVTDLRQRRAADRGIVIDVRDEAPGIKIMADQSLLASAVVRLIDNALIHAGDASRIEIALAAQPDRRLRLTVADDGAGMPPEEVTRCLAPFSQANMTRTRSHEGLGLGLPITAEVARLHGGSLSMRSQPGQGTEVEILIPHV